MTPPSPGWQPATVASATAASPTAGLRRPQAAGTALPAPDPAGHGAARRSRLGLGSSGGRVRSGGVAVLLLGGHQVTQVPVDDVGALQVRDRVPVRDHHLTRSYSGRLELPGGHHHSHQVRRGVGDLKRDRPIGSRRSFWLPTTTVGTVRPSRLRCSGGPFPMTRRPGHSRRGSATRRKRTRV